MMVSASLANRDHMQHLVEAAIAGEREPVPDHLAAGSFNGCHTCVGSEVSLAREARNVAYPIPKIFAAKIGPTPKISVSMVPEAFTSVAMRWSSSAIRRSKVRTSRTTSEASRLRSSVLPDAWA